jgi:hypothetical protein
MSPAAWDGMSLAFVSLDLPPAEAERGPDALRAHVERELAKKGNPVRWAVVQGNGENGDSYRVDAVVSMDATAAVSDADEAVMEGEQRDVPA